MPGMPSADRSRARRAAALQMVLVVFRNSLESDILSVLSASGIRSFTSLPEVYGTGETGGAFHSFEWRGANAMIMAALDARMAGRLVGSLGKLRDRLSAGRGGNPPLRVFVLPCRQAL